MPEAPPPPTTTPRTAGDRRLFPWAWRVAFVRLRFLAVLGVAFAVVAEWDVIRNHWDRLTRASAGVDPAFQTVSSDTEYFCPMDPGVVADWPGKCPVCNMALVRRPRGDATPLPEGVLARMQFSPYRLQLAGILSAPVGYRPLAREVEGPGRVLPPDDREGEPNRAEIDVFASEAQGLSPGQESRVILDGSEPLLAHVRTIRPRPDAGEVAVELEVGEPSGRLRPGMPVRGRILVPMADVEPFRSMPADPPPPRKGERRRAFICDEHPEVVRDAPGRCPRDGRTLSRRDLAANERLRWWCPMHPEVAGDAPGRDCRACGGMVLVPRIVRYRPRGEVLAVPETAVIDTGKRTVAYVERMPGMFEGVEVTIGPRCGDAYPVIRGLEPGQRVVMTGAFLVDAETRLNPSLAASYFGASRREPTASATPPPEAPDAGDRAAIALQKTCPVTGKPLGSMGKPARLEIEGRTVFLCCGGCEPTLRKDPGSYLAKLPPAAKRAP